MKLEVGKEYTLKYTGEFCHHVRSCNVNHISLTEKNAKAIFVGEIYLKEHGYSRNIFLMVDGNNFSYIMFGTENIDYIIEEKGLEKTILKIKELEEKLNKLKQTVADLEKE